MRETKKKIVTCGFASLYSSSTICDRGKADYYKIIRKKKMIVRL